MIQQRAVVPRQYFNIAHHLQSYIFLSGETHCTELFFVEELVEKDKIAIHYVNIQDQLPDLGTKHIAGILAMPFHQN